MTLTVQNRHVMDSLYYPTDSKKRESMFPICAWPGRKSVHGGSLSLVEPIGGHR